MGYLPINLLLSTMLATKEHVENVGSSNKSNMSAIMMDNNESATRSATKSTTLEDQHEDLANKDTTKYEENGLGQHKIQSYVDVVKRKMRNVHSSLGN